MSNSFFFAPVVYVKSLKMKSFFTLATLCKRAEAICKASGAWTGRKVEICHGDQLMIEAEPGDWGSVRITMNERSPESEARYALLVLAHVFHDVAARQSVCGYDWARIPPPRGRIKTGKAMSNSRRQRLYRERK
jgi:hypothetical protein